MQQGRAGDWAAPGVLQCLEEAAIWPFVEPKGTHRARAPGFPQDPLRITKKIKPRAKRACFPPPLDQPQASRGLQAWGAACQGCTTSSAPEPSGKQPGALSQPGEPRATQTPGCRTLTANRGMGFMSGPAALSTACSPPAISCSRLPGNTHCQVSAPGANLCRDNWPRAVSRLLQALEGSLES